MDATQALAELKELSSQVERAVVLDASGAVLGSTDESEEATRALTRAALDGLAAAAQLSSASGEVERVEVELAAGGLFVLREGGRTVAATTGPSPTAGLVAYDLRTCLQGIDAEKPKRRKRAKKAPEESE